jgi:uncharacterized membrane protein
MNKPILKSIGAVIAGFLVVVILSTVTDTILEKLGIFPSPQGGLFITRLLVVAFLYRSLYTVIGGYVTAWLAPNRPMRHVTILGIIGTIAGILGVIAGWNLSAHWYPIAIAATGFVFVWIGGKIRMKISP